MPLILKKDMGRATLLLWSADEGEEQLRALVTEDDRASADRFASPARRIEHLAWRAALRTIVPDTNISYTGNGTPVIEGLSLHIGVAHTRGMAAVIVSREPCAVDVENAERDFTPSRARFISPQEMLLADSGRTDFAAAVWCAKEAMYKFSGRRGLDFLDDLRITGCDLPRGVMRGQIGTSDVDLHVFREGEYLIVYI